MFSREEFTIQTLEYLAEQQKKDGSFRSMESYPEGHPLGDKGWQEHDPSPFIHANILIALLGVDHPLAKEVFTKGVRFIERLQEHRGFWRFWPHGGKTHNVPLDMDDTALCSFLMEKAGYPLRNRSLMLQNIDYYGYFNTWILPSNYNWWNISFYPYLLQDLRNIQQTMASPMLDIEDREPAVAANVLLYLGKEPKAFDCLNLLLKKLKEPQKVPLQYYKDLIVVFYHIARAYKYGIGRLQPAIALFLKYYNDGTLPAPENIFNKALTILTFKYFNLIDELKATNLEASFQEALPKDQSWESHIYFVSKDRNFRAGSPELTAAICLNTEMT